MEKASKSLRRDGKLVNTFDYDCQYQKRNKEETHRRGCMACRVVTTALEVDGSAGSRKEDRVEAVLRSLAIFSCIDEKEVDDGRLKDKISMRKVEGVEQWKWKRIRLLAAYLMTFVAAELLADARAHITANLTSEDMRVAENKPLRLGASAGR